jgi:SAM-dependent methyltransferase
LALDFPQDSFDVVVAEAVTVFVDRPRAAAGLQRVTRPGGRIVAAGFYSRRRPTAEARQLFLGEVDRGLVFDSIQEWGGIYSEDGSGDARTASCPFAMMTPRGFLADEGRHALAVMARRVPRPAYLRKMAWLWPRMSRAVPYLSYVPVIARKPEPSASGKA